MWGDIAYYVPTSEKVRGTRVPHLIASMAFPNIIQILKQNYPSQLEKISRYPKENELEVFLNTYPYTNLAYNVISAYLFIWWSGP